MKQYLLTVLRNASADILRSIALPNADMVFAEVANLWHALRRREELKAIHKNSKRCV